MSSPLTWPALRPTASFWRAGSTRSPARSFVRFGLGAASRFVIMAPEFLPIGSLFDEVGPAARGMYVSFLGVTSDRLPPAGRSFMREFAATQPGRVDVTAAYAAEATEVLLAAIARSDGTRASVVSELTRCGRGALSGASGSVRVAT